MTALISFLVFLSVMMGLPFRQMLDYALRMLLMPPTFLFRVFATSLVVRARNPVASAGTFLETVANSRVNPFFLNVSRMPALAQEVILFCTASISRGDNNAKSILRLDARCRVISYSFT